MTEPVEDNDPLGTHRSLISQTLWSFSHDDQLKGQSYRFEKFLREEPWDIQSIHRVDMLIAVGRMRRFLLPTVGVLLYMSITVITY